MLTKICLTLLVAIAATVPAQAMDSDRYTAIKATIARTTLTLATRSEKRAAAINSPRATWYRSERVRAARDLRRWSN
jgi:hypothetical protein